MRLARRSPRAISMRSRIQSETRYSMTATRVNQTISTATLQPIYNGRQLKRADSTKVPTPSLGDGKPNSLDLDQVHLDIECHRSRSQRLRVAPVVCANGCTSHGHTSRRWKAVGVALLLSLVSNTSGADDSIYKEQLSIFGTRVEIVIWGAKPAVARHAVTILSRDFKIMHRDWHAWKPGKLVNLNQAFAQRKVETVDD